MQTDYPIMTRRRTKLLQQEVPTVDVKWENEEVSGEVFSDDSYRYEGTYTPYVGKDGVNSPYNEDL